MWICILLCTPFEDTFENTHWGKVKQMQPMWLCILSCRPFKETPENTQRGKIKQMQAVLLCLFWPKFFEQTHEEAQTSVERRNMVICYLKETFWALKFKHKKSWEFQCIWTATRDDLLYISDKWHWAAMSANLAWDVMRKYGTVLCNSCFKWGTIQWGQNNMKIWYTQVAIHVALGYVVTARWLDPLLKFWRCQNLSRRTHSISRRNTYLTSESEAWWFNLLLTSGASGAILRTILSAMITLLFPLNTCWVLFEHFLAVFEMRLGVG